MDLTKEDEQFVASYDIEKYPRPSVASDTALFRVRKPEKGPQVLEVLLVQRKDSPYRGGWALPGGFCNLDESLEEAARRELQEETGLSATYVGQVRTWSAPHRDPRGRIISTTFLAVLPTEEDKAPIAQDDAGDVRWFRVHLDVQEEGNTCYKANLKLESDEETIEGFVEAKKDAHNAWHRTSTNPSNNLAFDHVEAIVAAISVLRARVWQSDLALAWVEDPFTLGALQGVYEAIFEEEMLRTTFLKHAKPLLERVADGASMMEQMYQKGANFHYDASLAMVPFWL